MVSLKVVTGYVPIADHPRSAKTYGALGEKLRLLKAPVQPFYGNVTSTWLYQMIDKLPFTPTWSISDNPKKNTLAYHCVIHQKFDWLYQASRLDRNADTFVWLDYGVAHCPGVTPEVINDFLSRIRKDDFAIPGCWPVGQVADEHPCWRFCAGVMVVPRQYVQDFKNLIQAIVMLHVNVTKNVSWEQNSMARAEQTGKLPMRWYKADCDQTLFTNY